MADLCVSGGSRVTAEQDSIVTRVRNLLSVEQSGFPTTKAVNTANGMEIKNLLLIGRTMAKEFGHLVQKMADIQNHVLKI